MACWHASAKLRLHTDSSLSIFRGFTKWITAHLRIFSKKVCSQFATRETPSEAAASLRRSAADSKKAGKVKDGPAKVLGQTKSSRQKEFNLVTPKMHSLVHYPDMIERFGTTDSYSTQLVCVCFILLSLLIMWYVQGEQEHVRVKRFYARTNKKSFERQIAKHQRRQALLRRMAEREADRRDPVARANMLAANSRYRPKPGSSKCTVSDPTAD
jgi:hypothetical protein